MAHYARHSDGAAVSAAGWLLSARLHIDLGRVTSAACCS
ncbi:hypothetical protein ABIA38_005922 [Embleya sp. AB8]